MALRYLVRYSVAAQLHQQHMSPLRAKHIARSSCVQAAMCADEQALHSKLIQAGVQALSSVERVLSEDAEERETHWCQSFSLCDNFCIVDTVRSASVQDASTSCSSS